MQHMKISVIGAGVIGLTTAYFLARDGHAVTVVDAAPQPGLGTSYANGGQLSYDYVAPLASPSVLSSLPKWIFGADANVKLRLSADMARLRWMLSFLLACNDRRSRVTTQTLLSLAELSRDALRDILAHESTEFNYRRNGKLVFYSDARSRDAGRKQMEFQATLGRQQAYITRDECVAIEPALAAVASRIVGAVYTASDEAGDCKMFCEELARILASPKYSAHLRFDSPIERVARDNARAGFWLESGERLDADMFVVCAGMGSVSLARDLGVHLPILPIHGFSISAPVDQAACAPDKSITDFDRKIVYARLGQTMRVAGFAEITGDAVAINADRIGKLRAEVAGTFPGACHLALARPWAGARPATPTGIPIIGPTTYRNVFVNAGHGGLGFTLACGSARLLADILAGRRAAFATELFLLPRMAIAQTASVALPV